MKKIIALLLTYIISTTMVLAQHTNASVQSDIYQVFTQINNVTEYQKNKSNSCQSQDTKELLVKIDKRIERARASNESLSESIKNESAKFKRVKYRQAKMTIKILKRNRRVNKAYRKAKQSFPQLTFKSFVKELKDSLKPIHVANGLAELEKILTDASSMESYLLTMKNSIETCETLIDGGNSGLIYLIIFIGVPVLAIVSALIALLFGAVGWALWLFVGAVAILLVFFIIGNLGSKLFIPNKEEI
jgi:hypothetical protein